MDPKVRQDLDAALAAKEAEVRAELAALHAPAVDSGDISFGKRVGDGTSIAVERITQVAASDRLQTMLAAITRAQAKLTDGTYGTCDRCGSQIATERIDALPWATTCVTC